MSMPEPRTEEYEIWSLRQRLGLQGHACGRPAVCVRSATLAAAEVLMRRGEARGWLEDWNGREVLIVEPTVKPKAWLGA